MSNYLDMTDEELDGINVDLMEDLDDTPEDGNEDGNEDDTASEDDEVNNSTEGEEASVEDDTPDEEDAEEKEPLQEDEVDEESEEEGEKPSDKDDKEVVKEIDYKAEYERLLSPFKANKKEVQVTSVDEALTLMQKGAGYEKNNYELNKQKALVKMLEQNDLLDQNKLNQLIDLSKKDPKAIKALVKEADIDGFDLEEEEDYSPTDYSVSDKEIALDTVLDDIRGTESFESTIKVVTEEWDKSSRGKLLDEPELIATINDHMSNGIYDQISKVVNNERILNKLPRGMSDIDAYQKVGDAIQAVNGFDHLFDNAPAGNEKLDKSNRKVSKPKGNKKEASLNRSGKSGKSVSNLNPLKMTDEQLDAIIIDELE